MSDYRVTVRVKNAHILNAIEEEGHESVAAFCRAWGLPVQMVSGFITFRVPPVGNNGVLKKPAALLCSILMKKPEELWTDEQLYLKLPKCTAEVDVREDELEATIRRLDAKTVVKKLMGKSTKQAELVNVSPRRKQILVERFSNEKTLKETADILNVCPERIRQLERDALRKIRYNWAKHSENGTLSVDDVELK